MVWAGPAWVGMPSAAAPALDRLNAACRPSATSLAAAACAGQAARTPSTWLFPGRNPGQPLAYATMFNQLRDLGFPMRTGRISALRELAAQASAPVNALGFHHTTTQRQHINAGATWSRYTTRR